MGDENGLGWPAYTARTLICLDCGAVLSAKAVARKDDTCGCTDDDWTEEDERVGQDHPDTRGA